MRDARYAVDAARRCSFRHGPTLRWAGGRSRRRDDGSLHAVNGGPVPTPPADPAAMLQQPANPPRLSAERRRALELLAGSRDGATEALLVHGHGFSHLAGRFIRFI